MLNAKYLALRAWLGKLLFRARPEKRKRLWHKLGTMLRNKVTIMDAIRTLRQRRIEADGDKSPEAMALSEWLRLMQNGNPLSVAVGDWVTTEEAMLIMAGEQSGQLQEAFDSISTVMTGIRDIRSAVYSGLAGPAFYLSAILALLNLFATEFIPIFTSHYQDHEWTGTAKLTIEMSNFVHNWFWSVLAGIIAVIGIFFYSLPRDWPYRTTLDRFLPYSVYRVMQGSSWLIALSALIKAGLRSEEAIEQLIKPASPWLRNRLQDCLTQMRTGLNMGEALLKSPYRFPDREISNDLVIYSQYTGLNEALHSLSTEWIDESVKQIRMRMSIITKISLGLLVLLICLIAVGSMELQMPTGAMSQLVN